MELSNVLTYFLLIYIAIYIIRPSLDKMFQVGREISKTVILLSFNVARISAAESCSRMYIHKPISH